MLPALWNNNSALAPAAGPTNRLSSFFDRFFDDDFFAPFAARNWAALPLGVWEDENNVYVEADAPGLKEGDVEVAVHDGDLIIRGERKCERQNGLYDGRAYGRFEQRVTLPAAVNPDGVEARLAHGVLSLTLPKSEESKPRKITIRTE